MVVPPGHRVDVTSCMAHTAGDTELKTRFDRNVGDDTRVHHRHFGGEGARGQGSGLQDRSGGSRSPGRLVWVVQEHTGQGNLVGTQPDR